jgi:hypothetical protein
LLSYLLAYLLTYSMEQSPSWEANRSSASQEIPAFYGTRRFITAFTSARHLSLSWSSLYFGYHRALLYFGYHTGIILLWVPYRHHCTAGIIPAIFRLNCRKQQRNSPERMTFYSGNLPNASLRQCTSAIVKASTRFPVTASVRSLKFIKLQCKETANGALRHEVHELHRGVLYYQNVSRYKLMRNFMNTHNSTAFPVLISTKLTNLQQHTHKNPARHIAPPSWAELIHPLHFELSNRDLRLLCGAGVYPPNVLQPI